MMHAIELKKPLVLVHEADALKGGTSLSELRTDCTSHSEQDITGSVEHPIA